MQKISTMQAFSNEILKEQKLTIGVDLGDRSSAYCVLNEAGGIILEHKLATTPEAMKQVFGSMPRCRMAMETGTHSPWVSRLLTALGHEVIVAHAQKVRLITKSRRKDDRMDARTLARLMRIDPQLLSREASQCAGAVAPDGDPCTSGTGERANCPGECRTRTGEVVRRATAQM
jgi:transposase